jgi:hypothetical protein
MANSNNWGEIYKSTWWGDKAWSANTLFIDSAPPGFGLNLLNASEDMNITRDWSQWLISVAANSTDEAAPNATDTAEKLTFTDAPQSRIQQQIALEANTTYTFSVYAKVRTGTQNFRLRNVTLGQAQQFTADTSWGLNPDDGRYSFSFTTGATAITHTLSIQNAAAAGTGEIFFWGAMLNEGATAGDYVKTEASVGGSAPAPAYSGFGDAFGGVTAYYSLRQFTEAETLNAIRVRRSSDDTEQDIGFDSNGDLDTTALLAFVGTGGTDNGFVTTFYDQSGNGNNATNSTDSEQPLIVSSGSLTQLNSKAAINGDGADDVLSLSTGLNLSSGYSIFQVVQIPSANTYGITISSTDVSNFSRTMMFGSFIKFSADGTNYDNYGGGGNKGAQNLWSSVVDGSGNLDTNRNGSAYGSTITSVTGTFELDIIGTNIGVNSFEFFQELIVFNSDQSSNLGTVTTGGGTGIEGNINTYFDIV